MKTVGLMMLFGLCTAIGMHIAAKKTERYTHLRALRADLAALSEALGTGPLPQLVDARDGVLFERLRTYLDARARGSTEQEAAEQAVKADSEADALRRFFTGLSMCSASQIKDRIEALLGTLETAEQAASESAKQAKTIRAVGVLIGVGVCILLF